MENIVVCSILLTIVVSVIWYLIKAKKSGQKCIGCPYGKQCSGSCGDNH